MGQGRTWKCVSPEVSERIKSYLLKNGGELRDVKNPYEMWRIKFSDVMFTYYSSGTLYSTPSNLKDPAVFEAWSYIDSLVGSNYVLPTKDFLIGLDETGKGELIGHTVLAGVIFPKEVFKEVEAIIGSADTKRRHKFEYWDGIFKKLDALRSKGLKFIYEKITPSHVDMYNLNKIMDISYQRILSIFFKKVDISKCRIVIDDYSVGPSLKRFLNFLEQQGAEVVVKPGSDETYLEVKAASIISKRLRESIVKAINEAQEYQINGLSVGSGNPTDPKTIKWLKIWWKKHKSWPWFVKRSFKTIRDIEGKSDKVKKIVPPIEERLLSQEFLDEFNAGRLSVKSLGINCPYCGSTLKGVHFVVFEKNGRKISGIKCTNENCKKLIENAGITLRYYCGYVLPDSSAIRRHIISNDLKASGFFENFTVILSPVVRKECDGTRQGKKEFEELYKLHSIGRLRLESVGEVKDIPDNLPREVRDEMIIKDCIKYDAILLTGDKSMAAFAVGKGIFTISL